jgi:nitrous oxide reductase accessory protein NosL
MCNDHDDGRRDALKMLAALGLAGLAGSARAQGPACDGDGTPMQFIPKTPADADPLTDELTKYPKCPYCGMDRTQWQHSRHLVQYEDDLADGTCSLHCLALSLALNLDRGPKAIYAADFGSQEAIKPLVPVDGATYLIGSKLKGTMSKISKMAFASEDAAKVAKVGQGGELGGFEEALRRTYLNMAEDTIMIRARRAERRRKMMQEG